MRVSFNSSALEIRAYDSFMVLHLQALNPTQRITLILLTKHHKTLASILTSVAYVGVKTALMKDPRPQERAIA